MANGSLAVGTVIKTKYGGSIKVEKYLAEGGQGEVYVVACNGGKDKKALKWYKTAALGKDPHAFYENIEENIKRGSPDKAFLWPEDITEWVDGTFGYITELFPDNYYVLTEFMLCHVRFKSFRTVVDAALRIVSACYIIHNVGYTCQNLNDENIFIEPETGKVRIGGIDYVGPDGGYTAFLEMPDACINIDINGYFDYENYTRNLKGKTDYTAPEIIVGDVTPNSLSDRFSMAVLLFILFTNTHPLKGKRYMKPAMTLEDERILLGSDPLFIMDPDNGDNGPDPVAHASVLQIWPCLPDYIKQIFLRVFSQEALQNPMTRPTELDWLRVLTRFRSDIVQCSACGNEVFTQDGRSCCCDACRKMVNIPFRLELEDYSIPAIRNSRIYRCQLGICNEGEALSPVAQVVEKVDQPGVYGLRNRSGFVWDAVTSEGAHYKVNPREVVRVKDGIRLEMMDATVIIRENSREGCEEEQPEMWDDWS